jgi:hypothetical protein
LVPSSEPAFDVTVYIVMNDFGHLGISYVETDAAQADESKVGRAMSPKTFPGAARGGGACIWRLTMAALLTKGSDPYE